MLLEELDIPYKGQQRGSRAVRAERGWGEGGAARAERGVGECGGRISLPVPRPCCHRPLPSRAASLASNHQLAPAGSAVLAYWN